MLGIVSFMLKGNPITHGLLPHCLNLVVLHEPGRWHNNEPAVHIQKRTVKHNLEGKPFRM